MHLRPRRCLPGLCLDRNLQLTGLRPLPRRRLILAQRLKQVAAGQTLVLVREGSRPVLLLLLEAPLN